MVVELRKRKPRAVPVEAPAPKKRARTTTKKAATAPKEKKEVESKAKEVEEDNATAAVTPNDNKRATPEQDDVLDLSLYEDEIQLEDGTTTSFKALVDESKSGVIVFTYPKASTPGCTTQACLFRDSYTNLSATGFSVFGLSGDSPTANEKFKTKQKLPYSLLCDPSFQLISAFGLKKKPKGTIRGVFAVNKEGKVLLRSPGSPKDTFEKARKLVKGQEGDDD
ncbi:hypothetical protein FQN57_002702 [Myotisia sp. PD_48]|nr:hypothetical protein FQN57_002702 [Myotisia sp. PD_48]